MMGIGNPTTIFNPLSSSVFHTIPSIWSLLKISSNELNPAQGLPQIPFIKLYFLNAMTKPAIGEYLNNRKKIIIGKNIMYKGMFCLRIRLEYFLSNQLGLVMTGSPMVGGDDGADGLMDVTSSYCGLSSIV